MGKMKEYMINNKAFLTGAVDGHGEIEFRKHMTHELEGTVSVILSQARAYGHRATKLAIEQKAKESLKNLKDVAEMIYTLHNLKSNWFNQKKVEKAKEELHEAILSLMPELEKSDIKRIINWSVYWDGTLHLDEVKKNTKRVLESNIESNLPDNRNILEYDLVWKQLKFELANVDDLTKVNLEAKAKEVAKKMYKTVAFN